ncbi:tryptophan synthase subunit alpha [Marinicellulosiphila megalodicopiae]|uniref:tryptophan synthase subunit alpha n=1 Tax=Marinicellulosiphila megalodicopiae TaxID=2724896 RepID=UPI003BAFFCBC
MGQITGRIQQTFARLKTEGKTALIPFVTAGDPNLDATLPIMHSLVSAGADIIELGVPFSDPMADGPSIQLANERSLLSGTTLMKIFEIVKDFRKTNSTTPIVLMGYLNPIEWMGYEKFAQLASQAGVDGILTVDMPPEETGGYSEALKANQLDPIFLLTPTTTNERAKIICEASSGYVYYVSLKGVTGSKALDVQEVAGKVANLRQFTSLPIAVGFGIKNGETAKAVAKISDGVIVGSALVNIIADNQNAETAQIGSQLAQLLGNMRDQMDS